MPEYASDKLLAVMQAGPDIESIYQNLEAEMQAPIADVMSSNFTTVQKSTPTSAVAAMLVNMEADSQHVFVVNADNKLEGLISARDIICRAHKIFTA